MLLLLAFIATYAAWVCAALAMPSHWHRLIRHSRSEPRAPPKTALRALALTLAVVALALCVLRDGKAFGVLLWMCLVCANAWLVVLTLANNSQGNGNGNGRRNTTLREPPAN